VNITTESAEVKLCGVKGLFLTIYVTDPIFENECLDAVDIISNMGSTYRGTGLDASMRKHLTRHLTYPDNSSHISTQGNVCLGSAMKLKHIQDLVVL